MYHISVKLNTIKEGGILLKQTKKEQELKNAIFCEKTRLSQDVLKEIIAEEVEKNANDIDTELIDICFDSLQDKNPINDEKQEHIRPKVKVVLVAAVILMLVFSTITASAFLFNIPERIAEYVNGKAKFDYNLKNADTSAEQYLLNGSELAQKIADMGVSPITLPVDLTNSNCTLVKLEKRQKDDESIDIYADFKINDIRGEMHIQSNAEWPGKDTLEEIHAADMISANGMDVLVFETDNPCIIIYKDGNIRYDIYLYTDFETTKNIAKNIK